MKESETSVMEYWIIDFVHNLKKKTIVSILDLEAFELKAMNLVVAIKRLRESRDNWRKKFEELKQEVKQNG